MSDNPQLTAYLLGELSPAESAALEQQLAASPELQQELDALRQTVTAVQSAFAQYTDTQPIVPVIDREKLHALLRSAVVSPVERTSSSVPPRGPGYEPTVAAPALLASTPTRGSTSRGWLVAGAVLVVGGLIGLSQMETGGGPSRDALVRSRPSRSDSEYQLSLERSSAIANGRGGKPLSAFELQSGLAGRQPESVLAQSMAATDPPTDTLAAIVLSDSAVAPTDAKLARLKSHTVRNLAIANPISGPVNSSGPVVDYSGVDAGLAATNFGSTALGLIPRYSVPASPSPSGHNAYVYFSHRGPADFFGRPTVAQQGLASQPLGLGRQPTGGQEYGVDEFFDDGTVASNEDYRFGFSAYAVDGRGGVPSQDQLSDLHWGYRRFDSRASGRGLQREQEPTELTTESLSLSALTDFIVDGQPTQPGSQLSRYDLDEAVGLRVDDLALGEGEERLSESKSEAMPQLQQALPPTLTVSNYENGFAQLGNAVKGWSEFRQNWDVQRGEALARGTEAAPSARPAIQELEEIRKLVADQQEGFKALREKTPGVEGKPLTEVDPEAAKQAQLALVRINRELNRQQAVWYYREGYVRQLEATIAAAEQYAHVPENDFVTPEAQPLSTFGIDVDTASYSNVRRFVESGQLPPPDAVRIEELINSFQYDGPQVEGEHPLAIAAEVSACPWQPQHQLLRVALKGKSIDLQQRPPARLVFLVDTSGSMSDENKLPLVKQSLKILVEQMREQDRLSIVTYSDNAGLLLDSTGGDKREAILAAIDGLHSDGSTNGEAGLKLAYEVAVKQFGEGATNRVMLCTDGDFNVGESADSELVKLIEKQRQTGVFLNIFGFGSGNLKDAKLEAIADKGNGQYIYIDGIKEARKTLLNELTGTLYTIAKDVKLQLEFNPNLVGSYRLVGYENRVMAAKDFSNDKVDSGDMGAGHSVVALYEIVPPGAPQPEAPQPETEPLKYKRAGSVSARSEEPVAAAPAAEAPKPADPLATELCTIRVRYKQPTSNESTKIETVAADPSKERGVQLPVSRDHVWATAVAQFGLLTRHSTFVGTGNYSQVLELAQSALGDDPTGQRREFVTLVRQTQHLTLKHEARLAELSDHLEDHRRAIQQIKAVEQAPDLMTKASCSGKYKTLLRQIEAPDDQPTYGEFKDYGRWEGTAYKTHQNLPHGYWVYVAPHWYIWGESTEQAAVK